MKEEKRMKRLLGLLLAVMVMMGEFRVRLRRTRTRLCQIG